MTDLEEVLRTGFALFAVAAQIAAGDFLERQKAVAVRAVIDKGGLKTGLDPRDDGLVDVALALFLGGRFDVEVNQLLTIDDRDAEFLGLRRIEKHALH